MKWISNLFSRYWRNVHFVIVLVLSLVLIFGGDKVTGPVSGTAAWIFHYPFSKIKNTLVDLNSVSSENRRLQLALVEAASRLSRLEEVERENARLRAVLGFEPPAGYSLVPAEVISIMGEKVAVAAVISCSAGDSIQVDQPLINEQGLIGRVVSVFNEFATVQLLTDPAHRVAVRVASSREMGIARYRVTEGLILDNFPVQGSIDEGDHVLSSGLGGIYPSGLMVGVVVSVERPEEEPFCRVRLAPAVNFNSLEEMFILRTDSR